MPSCNYCNRPYIALDEDAGTFKEMYCSERCEREIDIIIDKAEANRIGEPCEVCSKFVEGFEYQGCCDGRECGCMGMAVEPCVCSSECYKKLEKRIIRPSGELKYCVVCGYEMIGTQFNYCTDCGESESEKDNDKS